MTEILTIGLELSNYVSCMMYWSTCHAEVHWLLKISNINKLVAAHLCMYFIWDSQILARPAAAREPRLHQLHFTRAVSPQLHHARAYALDHLPPCSGHGSPLPTQDPNHSWKNCCYLVRSSHLLNSVALWFTIAKFCSYLVSSSPFIKSIVL